MKASKALAGFALQVQNQLIRSLMTARLKHVAGVPPVAGGETVPRVQRALAFCLCAFAVVVVTLSLLASPAPNPLPLVALSVLAACGLFFLLALALGRVQLSGRSDGFPQETIADAWPEAVMITSRLGETAFTNAAFDRLIPHCESTGLAALESWLSADPAASQALFRLVRAAGRGECHAEDVAVKAASGELAGRRLAATLRLSVGPIDVTASGGDKLMVWRIADITAQSAADGLRASYTERRLGAFDGAPVGLLTVRTDGSITELNMAMARMVGRSNGPANGEVGALQLLFNPTGAEILMRTLERPSIGVVQCALELSLAGGRTMPVRVLCPPASAGTDGVGDERVLVVLRTAWADPGASPLGESADPTFGRHFDSAPFGIATVTSEGRIARANPAFGHMILDGTGGIDEPVADVLCMGTAAEVRQQIEQSLSEALTGLGSIAPVDFTTGPQGAFGRRIYVTSLLPAAGSREAAIVYLVDTTEQKALEAKFTQSQKMEAVGKLAGGIAHDFNNVLTAIIGSADLMLQTHRASDASHKDIQNIKQSANRAAGLVRKLMAFSRQQTLQLEVLQLSDVVTDVRPMLITSLGEKIAITVSADRDLWYVKADRTQIDQVLVNLAVNAHDAMPNGGLFAIRTRNVSERDVIKLAHPGMTVGEYVLIEVEDTGTGMPPEVMAKIFEPFFTTKDIGKGTGLGLATVYGIIKQSAGFIFTDSTPGRGTTFRIYLPRAQVDLEAELAAQKSAKKEVTPDDLTGTATVLVVEDEDMVRSVAVRSLTRLGYRVLEAGNGFEALDVLAQHGVTVDIVVSDVVMPEMDGPALLKEVRKTRPDLKIIFVSGHTNDAFKTSIDDHEVFAFLQKPFSLPQLAAKVKEELGR
jgi:two-component system, cell cycle sensor histidine kinase and response regulator CckA